MPDVPGPGELVERARAGIERSIRRARHGARHVAGVHPPDVGASPKQVVWERGKTRLYRYDSDVRAHRPPVLLVMSLISKPYVLDLQPGNSFVEALVERGLDVYMLDWGVPDAAEATHTLETYTDELLPLAAAAVMRASGTRELHLFGYCLGGLLSLVFAMGHPGMPLRSLSLLATPIDFSDFAGFAAMLREGKVDPATLLDETGNVPADTVMRSLMTTNGVTAGISANANLLANLEQQQYVEAHEAMHGWSRDHIPFPGAVFEQLVDDLLQRNRLVTNDLATAKGALDAGVISCPVRNIVGREDRIVPFASTRAVLELLPHAEEVQFDAGHVGMLVGRRAHAVTIPAMADWLVAHSDPMAPDDVPSR